MDPNKRLAELLGICWHEDYDHGVAVIPCCSKCGRAMSRVKNPDFTDARIVLREMEKVLSEHEFEDFVTEEGDGDNAMMKCLDGRFESYNTIRVDYILDETGLLRDKAIKWMEGRKG